MGSFDPFTIGHQSVVRRALPLFDRLVIGVGVNGSKQCMLTPEQRVQAIRDLYAGDSRIVVTSYDNLTVDLAEKWGARYVVKGVRSVRDFEYEREQADINRRLTGLETLLLYAEPGLDSVSSSVVRELRRFGRDTSQFVPQQQTTTQKTQTPQEMPSQQQ